MKLTILIGINALLVLVLNVLVYYLVKVCRHIAEGTEILVLDAAINTNKKAMIEKDGMLGIDTEQMFKIFDDVKSEGEE